MRDHPLPVTPLNVEYTLLGAFLGYDLLTFLYSDWRMTDYLAHAQEATPMDSEHNDFTESKHTLHDATTTSSTQHPVHPEAEGLHLPTLGPAGHAGLPDRT